MSPSKGKMTLRGVARIVSCLAVLKANCKYVKSSSIELRLNSVALVRERTIPTERPPPVGEVSANFRTMQNVVIGDNCRT